MRKSIVTLIYILVGCFLPGCDFYAGYSICLTPNESYRPAESNMSLRSDFSEAIRVVESFAVQQGFEEYKWEKELLRRVYQKSEGDKLYRIYIIFCPNNDAIEISILEMQVRKRSESLEKMYIALRDKLRAKFGDRIK